MKQAIPLFLEDDTVTHIDWIVDQMGRRRGNTAARSDAVRWLVRRHWKEMQKKAKLERIAKPSIVA